MRETVFHPPPVAECQCAADAKGGERRDAPGGREEEEVEEEEEGGREVEADVGPGVDDDPGGHDELGVDLVGG